MQPFFYLRPFFKPKLMKNNYRMYLVATFAAVWLIGFAPASLFSQSDSLTGKKVEQSKKGLNLGALPAVAFDSDI